MENVNWVQGLSVGLPISIAIVIVIVVLVVAIWYQNKNKVDAPPSVANKNTNENSVNPTVIEGLQLPLQGSIKDPYVLVRNDPPNLGNILIFRSQSTVNIQGNTVPFNFPNEEIANPDDAQNALTNPITGGLQNESVANQYGFPWPPEASAQLLRYYPDPNKPPATLDDPENKLLPQFAFKRQYPSIASPFLAASTLEGNSWGSATAQNIVEGTSSKIQTVILEFFQDGLVQVEIAGGTGGSFTTGSAGPSSLLTQQGGKPGILWGYIKVTKGTQWNVQLSSSGGSLPASPNQEANAKAIKNQFVSKDSRATGGGTGSFLSGSEGGGTTQVSKGALQDPYTIENASGGSVGRNILMVAGGGGGASKNAYGGSAGGAFLTKVPTFNEPAENRNMNGFPGGTANVVSLAADMTQDYPMQTQLRNGLSGGGGAASRLGFLSKPGQSYTVNELNNNSPTNELSQNAQKNIANETSGASLRGGSGTSNPPGGGGGGAGLEGGGAGTWNFLSAPLNQHGAGGGGSSQISTDVQYSSNDGAPNANPQQVRGSEYTFSPTNYFLLGIPCRNETCT